jgi:hypothetical protein
LADGRPAGSPAAQGRRLVVALVVAGSLALGFAVAQATGIRWLGAVVLVVGGGWAALQLFRAVGPVRTTIVGAAYVIAFAISHPLGHVIGSWASVAVVSVLVGGLAWALGAPRQSRPTASRVSTTSPPTRSTR